MHNHCCMVITPPDINRDKPGLMKNTTNEGFSPYIHTSPDNDGKRLVKKSEQPQRNMVGKTCFNVIRNYIVYVSQHTFYLILCVE